MATLTPAAHRLLRRVALTAATAVLLVSVAYASVGLAPVGQVTDAGVGRSGPPGHAPGPPPGKGPPTPSPTPPPDEPDDLGGPIPDGAAVVHVGAAREDIFPAPPDGHTWKRDLAACELADPSVIERVPGVLSDLATGSGTPWPEDPDCIYLGGYGIGPMNPMVALNDDGWPLTVRALAVRDATGQTFALAVVDGIGWLWERQRVCPECGARQITERLADELGLDPAGIWIHATHSHGAPDFMGAWGGVPEWYLRQVTTSIENVIRAAVTGAAPAVLEVGEELARGHNRERRSTYRSAEEAHLSWLRALAVDPDARRYLQDGDRGGLRVLATLGAYGAHPTTTGSGHGKAHPDWPALFEAAVEARDGGTALHAMTGLGNLSTSGGTAMGTALAGRVPPPGSGRILTDATIRLRHELVTHPVSNLPLTLLGLPGFVDRTFRLQPATARSGPRPDTAPCVSAAPASVEAPVGAVRIGTELALTAGPGELFANVTNTIKEQAQSMVPADRSDVVVTMPLSQINDALGYLPQSFEADRLSQQGLGFAADGVLFIDYEDSYAIDICFGDEVLERTLQLLRDSR